jgi:hypothetical protein
MDLGRLRVRGQKSVFHVLLLKVTGWNILRAVAGLALTGKNPEKRLETGVSSAVGDVARAVQSAMARLIGWFERSRGRSGSTAVLSSP